MNKNYIQPSVTIHELEIGAIMIEASTREIMLRVNQTRLMRTKIIIGLTGMMKIKHQ